MFFQGYVIPCMLDSTRFYFYMINQEKKKKKIINLISKFIFLKKYILIITITTNDDVNSEFNISCFYKDIYVFLYMPDSIYISILM